MPDTYLHGIALARLDLGQPPARQAVTGGHAETRRRNGSDLSESGANLNSSIGNLFTLDIFRYLMKYSLSKFFM